MGISKLSGIPDENATGVTCDGLSSWRGGGGGVVTVVVLTDRNRGKFQRLRSTYTAKQSVFFAIVLKMRAVLKPKVWS